MRSCHGDIHHGQQRENKCLHKADKNSQHHERDWNQVRNKRAEYAEYGVIGCHVHCDTDRECDGTKNRAQCFDTYK